MYVNKIKNKLNKLDKTNNLALIEIEKNKKI